MKIFLDDDVMTRGLPSEWPHHSDFGKNVWGHASSPNEVIQAICCDGVEEISLDHDLGTDPIVGADVLRWMMKQIEQNSEFLRDKLPKEISVHSCNVVASVNMMKMVEDIMKFYS